MRNFLYGSMAVFSFVILSGCKKTVENPDESASFIKFYGNVNQDLGVEVKQTGDLGYVIVGTTFPAGSDSSDIIVVKVDKSGNQEFSKTFGGSKNDIGRSVQVTSDGGYVIVGDYMKPDLTTDIYMIKTDSKGDTMWTRKFGFDNKRERGFSVDVSSNGDYIILGTTDSTGSGDLDLYAIKTDPFGNPPYITLKEGAKSGLTTFDDFASNIIQAPGGNYVIASTSQIFGGTPRLVSLNSSLNFNNAPTNSDFVEPTLITGEHIANTVDGGFIVTGVALVGGISSPYLLKLDNNLNKVWVQTYTNIQGQSHSVYSVSDGGFVVAGNIQGVGDEGKNVFLLKTNSSGGQEWLQSFGGVGDDDGKDVRETADAGFIVTGTISFGEKDQAVGLIKTNSLGELKDK
jgi:hypothetical protein